MHLFAAPVPAGKKALEHETAYRLLAYAVQEVYGLPLPEIACDSRGKPFFPQRQEICFNLSHCRGLAVCGISTFPLGVDCESIRSLREGVLRRSFAQEEVLAVTESPQPDETFFRFWTLKEAFVKALGVGISYPAAHGGVRVGRGRCHSPPSGLAVPAVPAGQRACGVLLRSIGGHAAGRTLRCVVLTENGKLFSSICTFCRKVAFGGFFLCGLLQKSGFSAKVAKNSHFII